MASYPKSFDAMLEAWNERDMTRVRGHLERALAPDIEFIDPTIETHGLDEFERNVRDFRARFPEAVLRRASGVDSHHRLHRYAWEIAVGARTILVGYDVAETDAEGRVRRVLGFFGPLPALES